MEIAPRCSWLLALLIFTLAWEKTSAQVYEKVFSFTNANAAVSSSVGVRGVTGLILGLDGNFYGTGGGGNSGYGTVFKMTPGGVVTTLVNFTGNSGSNRGQSPASGLILGNDGNFYGTTSEGGVYGYGTVFKVTPNGVLTTLVDFAGNSATNSGNSPNALIQGSDGNFYGTTASGGANLDGTVFKMTPSGTLTTLVNFTYDGATNRGSGPDAGLIQGRDGNFYGTTYYGGANGEGAVFSISPAGVETVIYSFQSGKDGALPQANLINVGGTLYGTTAYGGGDSCDCGTVFAITP